VKLVNASAYRRYRRTECHALNSASLPGLLLPLVRLGTWLELVGSSGRNDLLSTSAYRR